MERENTIPDRVLALAIGLVVLAASGSARAQVSPGPLSRAHGHLEGALKCFECHGRGQGAMDGQCLACHREIAWLIDAGAGLHGREARDDCTRCHPEHGGEDFDLIEWEEGDPGRFRHDRAGWPLAGAHRALACGDCHKPTLRTSKAADLAERARPEDSWVGLRAECAACHADPHRGSLGSGCETCHGARAWLPAERFDHATTEFPLTGRHATVACAKCHPAEPAVAANGSGVATVRTFAVSDHAECATCHADVHEGRLGTGCAACHVTDGFALVRTDAFDHDRTRYPLRGRHRAVPCAACHAAATGGKRPSHRACGDCHADAHAGLATIAGAPADCAACHRVEGFRPSTWDVERHRSIWPLEGGHAGVPCRGCHPQAPPGSTSALGTARVQLRPAHARCLDCHADTHGGQLAERDHAGECSACHAVAAWRPSRFTPDQHAATRLPLVGGHAEVACSACHGPREAARVPVPERGDLGTAQVWLSRIDPSCAACHVDPHAGRFAPGGDCTTPDGCAACHGTAAFRPSMVDAERHRTFAWPLEAAHRAVPCSECHRELLAPRAATTLVVDGAPANVMTFRTAHERCVDCHDDPHGGQFQHRADGGRCDACHDAAAFRPAARFDHDRDARFRLEGVHARVPCAGCHPLGTGADGVTVYAPLPLECAGCHRTNPP